MVLTHRQRCCIHLGWNPTDAVTLSINIFIFIWSVESSRIQQPRLEPFIVQHKWKRTAPLHLSDAALLAPPPLVLFSSPLSAPAVPLPPFASAVPSLAVFADQCRPKSRVSKEASLLVPDHRNADTSTFNWTEIQ